MHANAAALDSESGIFDLLPDELVVVVMQSTGGAGPVMRLGATCRRMLRVAADLDLWRRLCLAHCPRPLLHEHFAAFGKDWKWVYRALLPLTRRRRKKIGHSVGTSRVERGRGGETYSGDFRRTQRHGYGRMTYTDSCDRTRIYEGEWHGGLEHGRGRVAWSSGETYEGDWADGQPHGHGVAFTSGALVREGLWRNGRFVESVPSAEAGPCAVALDNILSPTGDASVVDTTYAVRPISMLAKMIIASSTPFCDAEDRYLRTGSDWRNSHMSAAEEWRLWTNRPHH
ncbi:Morn repeat protein [Pandoravirus inopinatum]|uniref:Morn repeat protein n=1 Tax=Pandoravirus inopinatum TaxID=1605721 RepID=A0A0B5J6Y8_9VIRU|nr:Morn repeat protein [Pandoravirus inopinatum]AJF97570.1 Morn repeat protein [Pandoravirus inopinatum]